MASAVIPSIPAVDDATKRELIQAVIEALSNINGRVGSLEGGGYGQIANGSFEVDDGAGGFANWTIEATGSFTVSQADADSTSAGGCVSNGTYSLKIEGGGSAGTVTITSDAVPVQAGSVVVAGAVMGLDSGSMDTAQVKVRFYDSDGTTVLATKTVYDAGAGSPAQPALPSVNSSGEMASRYAAARVPLRATYMRLIFYFADAGNSPVFYMDSAKCEVLRCAPYGAASTAIDTMLPPIFGSVTCEVTSVPNTGVFYQWIDGDWETFTTITTETAEQHHVFFDPSGVAYKTGGGAVVLTYGSLKFYP